MRRCLVLLLFTAASLLTTLPAVAQEAEEIAATAVSPESDDAPEEESEEPTEPVDEAAAAATDEAEGTAEAGDEAAETDVSSESGSEDTTGDESEPSPQSDPEPASENADEAPDPVEVSEPTATSDSSDSSDPSEASDSSDSSDPSEASDTDEVSEPSAPSDSDEVSEPSTPSEAVEDDPGIAEEESAEGTTVDTAVGTDTADAADPETTTEVGSATVESVEKPRVGDFLTVDGTENWEYELDISDYADGKYNLIVRGIDNAGNVYTTPAIDVNIDQESDRPLVSISNPEPGGSVGGNLNILGTATDDDAIDRVEVKIGEGEFTEALGEEYWSYYLDTENLDDGAYVVTVRAIDINGVEGDEVAVEFNLDNQKP